jgi:hypothetical protein
MAMEKPPVPPEVQAQGAPFAQVGGMMGQQAAAGNPLTTAFQAVSKVLEQMAKTSPKMAPFVQRATAILKAGLEETLGGKQGAPEETAPQAAPPGNMPG